jgi:RimJ/RimL family protein N-acetyltransferase
MAGNAASSIQSEGGAEEAGVRRIKLRRPIEGDVEARAAHGYHPDILAGVGVRLIAPVSMTLNDARKWVDRIAHHTHAWIIEHDGTLTGEVRLDNLNAEDQRASLAIAIVDHGKLGQGLGREAIKACLRIAFEELNLHRVSVRVLASNLRAIRCYEACGFKREGIERASALTDWGWQDDVMMGILASEFC